MRYIYEWKARCFKRKWWMTRCFYSYERDRDFWCAAPLFPLVIGWWWIQDKWARHAHAPSWIEREIERRREKR